MRGPIPSLPSRNARNKKTRNPGFQSGQHWVSCDRCGCDVRAGDARITWEGFVVCPDDWEPRHPQDFVRAKEDRISPEGFVRSESPDTFITPPCMGITAVADDAVADCAVADSTATDSIVPQSTFNQSTL